MSIRTFVYIVGGFMLGGVLFARVFGKLFHRDVVSGSKDGNPGTANAFVNGGFACGMLTLIGDLGKGFLPVYLYLHLGEPESRLAFIFVMVAPVAGHIFTPWYHFNGGKGIAATFGCLLGMLPAVIPVGVLVVSFLFFSLVLRVSPHYQRTICTYITAAVLMFILGPDAAVCIGFLIITLLVLFKMHMSNEEREKVKVKLLWMH